MKQQTGADAAKRLTGIFEHVPPRVEVARSELRSDSSLPVPVTAPAIALDYICVTWDYVVAPGNLAAFRDFLQNKEQTIMTGVSNTSTGAKYLGTYAVYPYVRQHRTYWGYNKVGAIDGFKQHLDANRNTALFKNLKKLAGFVVEGSVETNRQVLAQAFAGQNGGQNDSILNLFGV
jgi:hypothetical protein